MHKNSWFLSFKPRWVYSWLLWYSYNVIIQLQWLLFLSLHEQSVISFMVAFYFANIQHQYERFNHHTITFCVEVKWFAENILLIFGSFKLTQQFAHYHYAIVHFTRFFCCQISPSKSVMFQISSVEYLTTDIKIIKFECV